MTKTHKEESYKITLNPEIEFNLLNGFLELSEILYDHHNKQFSNFCQQCGYPCGTTNLCSYCSLINEFIH